ncbi:MAG: hypothetical protein HW403_1117 [Dehalococcoidia bacterium]|nr:hypothetical protein [Dehalococcoidia bacterium]
MSARRGSRHRGDKAPVGKGWLLVLTMILLVGVGFAFTTRPWDRLLSTPTNGVRFSGTLVPEHIFHSFGLVSIDGGPVMAKFPLMVQGPTLVTDLGTT